LARVILVDTSLFTLPANSARMMKPWAPSDRLLARE